MPPADTTVRDMVLRRQRRRRTMIVSGVAIALVGVAAVAGLGLSQAQRSAALAVPDRVPSGTTPDKTGLALASGPVRVEVYLDYLCPSCRRVDTALAPALDRLVKDGKVELVYHPLGHLDDASTPPGYSTRAGSAVGCAADGGKAMEYSNALFTRQPREGSAGLSDDQLIGLGREVGITAPSFAACVRDRTYVPWIRYSTQTAYDRNIAATPTVLVNGERIEVATPASAARLVSDAVAIASGGAR